MIVIGNARQIPLADATVQCVVTSPPYWNLRDYGVAGQIGLEPTPDLYVQSLVEVFAEVGRVLRDDGTLWLNLGDSYAGSGMTGGTKSLDGQAKRTERMFRGHRRDTVEGLAQKQLIGIPWRVAFARQAAGWYLRSDIIWAKPNPMPESVRDRPTKSHEYVFLLTKSARYVYDADALREPQSAGTFARYKPGEKIPSFNKLGGSSRKNATFTAGTPVAILPNGRNARSVWTISPESYPDAHFATMPTALVRRCLLAGSRPGDLVLDPFGGSGTVAEVADALGCRVVSMDLAPHYAPLAVARTRQPALPYAAEASL